MYQVLQFMSDFAKSKVDGDTLAFGLRAGNRDFLILKIDFFILLKKDESRK